MALADGIVGLLYAPPPPSTAVGAALWAGTQLHDLGSFSTAADAKQVLSRMPRLMATARPARYAPSTAGQARPQPSAVPALPPRHSAPALAVPAASLATAGPAQPPQLGLAASVPVPASRPALSGPRGAPATAPARQALAPQSGPSQQQLAQPQLTEQQQQLTQQVMQLLYQAAAAREAGRREATAGLSRGPTGSTVSGRSVASSVLQELLLERSLARSVRSGGDAFAPLPQGKSVTSDEANNLFTQFTGHH
ncbi:hypothetical protein HYH03_009095 [Edaphochlamys debaryana]|uniref:Uncharacterized protein n=1 Tax=Edaphochlamys debaryana TaxID=47281 RepID=A0A835Y549_9CHLO|nr:hypothetical protein HYH03_009095 [Edaphochlamys debaryana]|eukprot:KAG2492680.1 hypothetical protein HYH03_009095 [Edaphochlamys debaryana]